MTEAPDPTDQHIDVVFPVSEDIYFELIGHEKLNLSESGHGSLSAPNIFR